MSDDKLQALLVALEDRLRSFGAPIADSLQPGLPEHRVRAALAAERVSAPAELVTWWGWHNGTHVAPPKEESGVRQVGENTIFDVFHLMSLEDSLRDRRWMRRLYDEDLEWPDGYLVGWIPLLTSGDITADLCADAEANERLTPIYLYDHGGGNDYPPRPRFESLAELVSVFVRLFDDDVVRPNPDDPRLPSLRGAELPEYVRRLKIW
jgi:hypothetical protein